MCYISAIMWTDRRIDGPLREAVPAALVLALLLYFLGPALLPAAPPEPDPACREEKPPAPQQAAQRPPKPAQKRTESADSSITVLARTWDKSQDRIFAQGDVELHYKDLKLFADELEVNTETKDVNAVGNVVIQSPNQVISADKAFYNLDSREHKLE
ncbi:MAG: OstA-like protein, partial [Candidatus Aminicenantes bacterium]|nr:OstA-like protein [Candidatus Aminicenantes bacterium]